MTRFEWAYPSGVEDVKEQWISGSTMILAIVIMNAVYLVSETRVQVGEPHPDPDPDPNPDQHYLHPHPHPNPSPNP